MRVPGTWKFYIITINLQNFPDEGETLYTLMIGLINSLNILYKTDVSPETGHIPPSPGISKVGNRFLCMKLQRNQN